MNYTKDEKEDTKLMYPDREAKEDMKLMLLRVQLYTAAQTLKGEQRKNLRALLTEVGDTMDLLA